MIEKINLSPEIIESLVKTGAILLGAFAARVAAEFAIKAAVKKFEDSNPEKDTVLEKRVYTLSSIIKNGINICIAGITLLTIMSQWGINIAPLLAGAGVVGLAIGFGSQAVVRDVVTGFFILMENTYNIGDEVNLAGKTGRVEEMNLRTTIILDNEGNRYTIPNSSISVIQNVSHKKDIEG